MTIEKTLALAADLVGTPAGRPAEDFAAEEGFKFDGDAFDGVAFICARCDWYCSMDESNDTTAGDFVCDDCAAES